MSEPVSNQRVKKDQNQLGTDELKGFTDLQISGNDGSITIETLNSDCLEQIFRALPLVDLFRIQRVCKYWRIVSMDMCRRITRLDMTRSFWGISSDDNINIDLSIFTKVLNICGPNLRHIGLSNDEDSYSTEYRRIHVESDKKLWILIHDKCPSITSIDFGQSRSIVALKFVSHTFKNLTYFKMKKFTLPGNSPLVHETHLSDVFANNENLKRVELYEARLTTECLAKLNSANLEELTLENCMINSSEHLVKALKQLKKLKKITMTRCACLQETWINGVLEALTSTSDSLKYLDFYLYNPTFEIIDSIYFGKLKQLENLRMAGDTIITDDVLMVVAKCCRKLRKLQISNSKNVTDIGFEKLAELTELKCLILDDLSSLTDEVLPNMTNIVELEVHRCPYFQNNGFWNLIKNSQCIRTLKILNCKEINELELIEEVHRCSNENLELTIDNSETNSDYFKCIYKLRKSNSKFMKVIKKTCYDCFILKGRAKLDCNLCCNIVESTF